MTRLTLLAMTLLIQWPATTLAVPRMQERVAPCIACHGEAGQSAQGAYVPPLAGKPAGYLQQQLINFRDGRRPHRTMAGLLRNLSDQYLAQMAQHFAQLEPAPHIQPAPLSPADAQRVEQWVFQGDATTGLPACNQCHGEKLQGTQASIPSLLGLDAEYIAAQLGAWQAGVRHAVAPDCMATIAAKLNGQHINLLARWLASQPVTAAPRAEDPQSAGLPIPCGGL